MAYQLWHLTEGPTANLKIHLNKTPAKKQEFKRASISQSQNAHVMSHLQRWWELSQAMNCASTPDLWLNLMVDYFFQRNIELQCCISQKHTPVKMSFWD